MNINEKCAYLKDSNRIDYKKIHGSQTKNMAKYWMNTQKEILSQIKRRNTIHSKENICKLHND